MRQPGPCVLCANLLHCCRPGTWPSPDHIAMQRQANTFFTLHTALFTPCTSRLTLPQFTLHCSSHLKSSHFFSPHVTSSQLFSSHPIPSHMSSKQVLLNRFHLIRELKKSSPQLISALLHARKLLLEWSLPSLYKKILSAQSFCTQKLATQMHLHRKILTTYFVLQSLHKALPSTTLYYRASTKCPSTTLYYKACTRHFPVLLWTTNLAPTKLAQSTSQYYFVPQSLQKVRPSTTLYCKACTKYLPVPLCTAKLAQSTYQYYFALQACMKHVPVLFCTTKLAQSTSQYYFVLQSLHEARPNTILYYKACTKHFPVLLCTAKLALWALMQPLHYDLRCPGTKDKSISHAAVAPSNIHAAITLRSVTGGSTNAKNHAHMSNHSLQNTAKTDSTLKPPQPHPPHTRGTFHPRLQPLYTEKHKVACSGFPPQNTSPMQRPCSHYTAICNRRVNKRIESRTHEQPLVAEHGKNRFDLETTAAAPAAHTRYLSSPASATLHRKPQGFVLQLSPPKHKPHATSMQPLHYHLPPEGQQTHRITHAWATTRCRTRQKPIWSWNNRSRTGCTHEVPFIAGCSHFTRKNTRFRAPAFPPNASPMQHSCNHCTAICNRRVNKRKESRTHEQPLVAEHGKNRFDLETTAAAPAAHTRYLSSPAAATLHRKTQGCVLRLSPPKHKPHATFMQPLHYDLQPEGQQTQRITHTWATTRCRMRQKPIRPWNHRSRTRRAHEVLFTAGCSHFTRKNTRFRSPAFPPKTQAPCQRPCSHYTAICNRRVNKRKGYWGHLRNLILSHLRTPPSGVTYAPWFWVTRGPWPQKVKTLPWKSHPPWKPFQGRGLRTKTYCRGYGMRLRDWGAKGERFNTINETTL